MTKLRSRSLVSQFRTLFAGGTLSGLGEGELLERFVGHRDEAAFAELVARHGPMVLAVCRRWLDDPHDVEDAFQATFLVLVRKAGGLRDRQSVAQWLYGVSHRVARHARAAAMRRREREMRTVARRREEAGLDPADELAGREILAMVHDELARLPEKQQAAAVLCLVQGLSHEAAARALGWPLGTLKTRIADARATLSRRLARRGAAPSGLAAIGGSALRLPVCSLPPDLAGRTIGAALDAVAAQAMKAGVVGKSAAALARNVSRTMLLVRLGTIAIGLAVLGALAFAAPVLLRGRPAPPTSMKPLPAADQEAAPALLKADPAMELRRDQYGDALPAGAILRLGTIKYRQDSPIYRLAYAPDGKHFVTDGQDGILRVWDAAEGRLVRRIDPDVGAMEDFALTSRDNRVIASGIVFEPVPRFLRRVVSVELETGIVVDRGDWKVDSISDYRLVIAPDRRILALVLDEGGILVVDAWTGAEVCRFEKGNGKIQRLVFARDGKRLAAEVRGEGATTQECRVLVFDVPQKKELRAFNLTAFQIEGLEFSPDGTRIAGSIHAVPFPDLFVWDIESGERMSYSRAELGPISYSADGRILAGVGSSGQLSLFDLHARRPVVLYGARTSDASDIALAPDGRAIVTDGGPLVLHSWDIKTQRDRFAVPEAHTDAIKTLLVTPDAKTIITVSKDESIRFWDSSSGRQARRLTATSTIDAAAPSPDGKRLVVASQSIVGAQLDVWDMAGGGPDPISRAIIPMFPGTSLVALGIADDGRSVLMISSPAKLQGWDLAGKRIKEMPQLQLSAPTAPDGFEKFQTTVSAAVFLGGGKRLALDLTLGGLRMVETATGKESFRTDGGDLIVASPDERILAITESVDGRTLRRGQRLPRQPARAGIDIRSASGVIRLVDAGTGKESRRITVDGSKVWALAFAPDGKTLAATTGWESGQIHFFDVATGKETRTIDTPPLQSPALAFTPDGSRLVSAMADGSVLVWDVKPPR